MQARAFGLWVACRLSGLGAGSAMLLTRFFRARTIMPIVLGFAFLFAGCPIRHSGTKYEYRVPVAGYPIGGGLLGRHCKQVAAQTLGEMCIGCIESVGFMHRRGELDESRASRGRLPCRLPTADQG
jgi:hypothetical protein